MYQRLLSTTIQRVAKQFPVICVNGPRQSGKTTIVRSLFNHLPYVSFENPDIYSETHSDPRSFLSRYKDGAIFDEVQHSPHILSYLQQIVDESPQKGRYILTGSQNFTLNAKITQSLAGRVAMLKLLPLSLTEFNGVQDTYSSIWKGGYPALHSSAIDREVFYSSYIETYLERDVRQLAKIGDLFKFQLFLKLCAGRIGQVVNFSSLATDCGISPPTAQEWFSILTTSFILFPIHPYFNNFGKRIIKMPKIYFYDTGLASYLLNIETPEKLYTHYLRGGLFENMAILELMKSRFSNGLQPNLYFWRDQNGHEIDCIAEVKGGLRLIEIKSSATFNSDFFKDIEYFKKISRGSPLGDNPYNKSYVIYDSLDSATRDYKESRLLSLQSSSLAVEEE